MAWPTEPISTLVTFGESTTAGMCATSEDQRWANRFAELVGRFQEQPPRLINSGLSASVVSPRSSCYDDSHKPSAQERLDDAVIAHQPDLVVIQYGLNDMRAGTPLGLFAEVMQDLIDRIGKGTRAAMMLGNVAHMTGYGDYAPFCAGSDETNHLYNLAIAHLGAVNGLPVADVHAAMNHADGLVHPDGVHPNDMGHEVIAQAFFTAWARAQNTTAGKRA
jgi:lysophospholipase L1-like esterase